MPNDHRDRLKEWLQSGEIRLQPLTYPQRELWESSPVPAEDASNNVCAMIHLRGMLTPEGSEAALQKVMDRQEVLRLSFLPGVSGPLQVIRNSGKISLVFQNLSATQRHPEAIDELAEEIFDQPFDLKREPLYRAVIFRRSAGDHVLVLALHHAIADDWTLGVFVRDLFNAYLQGAKGDDSPLPAVPLSYSDWGSTERAFWQPTEMKKRTAYWRTHLADAPRLWSPPDGEEVESGELQRSTTLIPAELARGLRELARLNGATLFSTLLTAFQVALSKWAGADDIVVGTPVANRNRQAIRETMGYFSGIVPLRGKIDPQRGFSSSLGEVHRETVNSFANAIPFVELANAVGEVASPGYNPVFEVRFALQNHPAPDVSIPGLSLHLRMRATGTARFDLGCEITELGDALEIVWLARDHLFTKQEIQELRRIYQLVLVTVCRSPEILTSSLLAGLK